VKVLSASGLAQYFAVNTAAGYLSASEKRLLVGLGDDATARLIEIQWPSGVVQKFDNVKGGQTLTATEPRTPPDGVGQPRPVSIGRSGGR
jgi:hypothetical protein